VRFSLRKHACSRLSFLPVGQTTIGSKCTRPEGDGRSSGLGGRVRPRD
jgi:hypothetical protein